MSHPAHGSEWYHHARPFPFYFTIVLYMALPIFGPSVKREHHRHRIAWLGTFLSCHMIYSRRITTYPSGLPQRELRFTALSLSRCRSFSLLLVLLGRWFALSLVGAKDGDL